MQRAIQAWIDGSNSSQNSSDVQSLRLTYTTYGCMLLLPHNAFQSQSWTTYQDHNPGSDFERLYELICHHLKVTHVAINHPIPALEKDQSNDNVIRSPIQFTPLYGDFGHESASSPPTDADFDAAFWVTAKQNGIFQTWAPRWTMFSRGNISEKARLLSLPSVVAAVEQGKLDGTGCTAVDLYAGIGYFAFSYLKAGVERILCWDLNPWSIEGLKRGVSTNKWTVTTFCANAGLDELSFSKSRLLLFNESNELAASRVRMIHDSLPPIRHVNCGLLPTSRGSWQTAIEIVDRSLGGWVHVHENFAISEIERKAEEVRCSLQSIALRDGRPDSVKIEHINRLKSYAPGVMHCVIDVYIPADSPKI